MKTRFFILGAIFAVFFSVALIVSSQNRKQIPVFSKPNLTLPIKSDSISIPLPDSTKEKIRNADLKGMKLDSIAVMMEKRINLDRKQNDLLKHQGKELERIGVIKVDTIPVPKFATETIQYPSEIRIVTEEKRGFWNRVFKRK